MVIAFVVLGYLAVGFRGFCGSGLLVVDFLAGWYNITLVECLGCVGLVVWDFGCGFCCFLIVVFWVSGCCEFGFVC